MQNVKLQDDFFSDTETCEHIQIGEMHRCHHGWRVISGDPSCYIATIWRHFFPILLSW